MDPDEALKDIRSLTRRILDAIGDPAQVADWGDELAERVEALDHWLAMGGFMPRRWDDPRRK